MSKFAIFVFADNETKEGLGRVVNAMEAVKELTEKNNDVKLFFDGYGTAWPAKLTDPEHIAHDLYESVKEHIAGACLFCATAFEAKEGTKNCGIEFVDEYEQHISISNLVSNGYQILNF